MRKKLNSICVSGGKILQRFKYGSLENNMKHTYTYAQAAIGCSFVALAFSKSLEFGTFMYIMFMLNPVLLLPAYDEIKEKFWKKV